MRPIDLTLVERMKITDGEVERRKHLFDLTEADAQRLHDLLPYMTDHVQRIVERFYEDQLERAEVADIIGDAETLGRLKAAMISYILTLFSGRYDIQYVNQRLRVGQVHKRIKVSPKLYMSALRLLQSFLDRAIEEWAAVTEAKYSDVRLSTESLRKIMLFDAQLVFDAYIEGYMSEVENARREIQVYATDLEMKILTQARDGRGQSTKDGLTGLLNQKAFHDLFDHELAVARQYVLSLSLIFIDLNAFKKVNDDLGHAAGDAVLRAVADTLESCVRQHWCPVNC